MSNKAKFYKDVRSAREEGNSRFIQNVSNSLLKYLENSSKNNGCECMPSTFDLESRTSSIHNSGFCQYTKEVDENEFRVLAIEIPIDRIIKDNKSDDKTRTRNVNEDENLSSDFVNKIKSSLSVLIENYSGYSGRDKKIQLKADYCERQFMSSIDKFAESYSLSGAASNSDSFADCEAIRNEIIPLTKIKNFPISESDLDEALKACISSENKGKSYARSQMISFIISRITKDDAGEYSDEVMSIISAGLDIEAITAALYLLYTAKAGGAVILFKAVTGKLKLMDIPKWLGWKLLTGFIIYQSVGFLKCLTRTFLNKIDQYGSYDRRIITKNIIIIMIGVEIENIEADYVDIFGEKVYTQNPQDRIDQAFETLQDYLIADLEKNSADYAGCIEELVDFF